MATDVTVPASAAVAVPISIGILGFVGALAVEWWHGTADRAMNRDAHKGAIEERQRAFQRETILTAQDRCLRLLLIAMKSLMVADHEMRSPASASEAAELAGQEVHTLRVRIADDEARERMRDFVGVAVLFLGVVEAEQLLKLYGDMNERLGFLLRNVL